MVFSIGNVRIPYRNVSTGSRAAEEAQDHVEHEQPPRRPESERRLGREEAGRSSRLDPLILCCRQNGSGGHGVGAYQHAPFVPIDYHQQHGTLRSR